MWMIYGANGYTGELIARAGAAEKPVLAGRNAQRIQALARELGCQARVFGVGRPQLDGVSLVLHCAGPFIHTSAPMVRACLDAGVHYLDITGEISVFESIMALDAEAKRRNVTLLPGVGFDVVPTDCLAAMLARRLPDAAACAGNRRIPGYESDRAGLPREVLRLSQLPGSRQAPNRPWRSRSRGTGAGR